MIKNTSRIWVYIYSICSFCFGAFMLSEGEHTDETTLFSLILIVLFFSLLTFGIPLWMVIKSKTVILDDKGIKIVFPFLHRKLYYFYTDIDYFETYTGDARGIEIQEMKITLKNKGAIIITSGANTKFEEMNIFLQQKIEKK